MENLFDSIYKGKKVLITGNTGFKGSWLTYWLVKMGANVKGISLKEKTTPNHFSLLNLDIETDFMDINNFNELEKSINNFKPEIIFHLAAQPLVRKSYFNPLETLNTNIIGTANIFEISKKLKSLRAIVNVTTDKCYLNKEINTGYIETDALGGYDPYSASKACSEIITSSYRNSFFNQKDYNKSHSVLIASARAGNVIGGGDWSEDRLIPDLIKASSNNKKTIIRSPKSIRPWQHVLEPLTGYLLIGNKLLLKDKIFADSWNLGPSKNEFNSVAEVVNIAKKHWGKINFEFQENKDLHEAKLLKLNSNKAYNLLNWKSIWKLEEAVEKTVLWCKEFEEKNIISTEIQLEEYIHVAKKEKLTWT